MSSDTRQAHWWGSHRGQGKNMEGEVKCCNYEGDQPREQPKKLARASCVGFFFLADEAATGTINITVFIAVQTDSSQPA